MRIHKLPLIAAAMSAASLPMPSQAEDASKGIAGYLNPATGVFSSRPVLTLAAAPISATATLTVNFTVKIDSAIPLSQPITCSVSIGSFDSSFNNSASSQSYVQKSTASLGTCTVTIPYIWQIATASTTMSVNPSISTGNYGSLQHNSSASIAPFAVPTTGTKIIAVTLAL